MADACALVFSLLRAHLDEAELANAIVYAVDTTIPAEAQLAFPGIQIEAPAEGFLVFIDRDPLANWTHSARYVLLGKDGRQLGSWEAKLPPFGAGNKFKWRVAYKAQSVPDSAISIPQ